MSDAVFWFLESVVVLGAGFIGHAIGQRNANAAIHHEQELVETLTAERDSLQTRYMALLNKEATPCQSKR